MGKNWKKPLTEAQISEACALRNLGRGWAAIARAVGATEYTLIKHLDARRLRLKREYDYKYHLEHRTSEGGTKTDSRPNIPPHVLENRDRRMNQERSLSAVVFGDPPYEQSALGKRNGEKRQETEARQTSKGWEIVAGLAGTEIAGAGGRSKRDRANDAAPEWQRLLARLSKDGSSEQMA